MSLDSAATSAVFIGELPGNDANLVDHAFVGELLAVFVEDVAPARSELGVVDAVFAQTGEDERWGPFDQPAIVLLLRLNGVVLLDVTHVAGGERDCDRNLRIGARPAVQGDSDIGDAGFRGDALIAVDEVLPAGLRARIGGQEVVHPVVVAIHPALGEGFGDIGRGGGDDIVFGGGLCGWLRRFGGIQRNRGGVRIGTACGRLVRLRGRSGNLGGRFDHHRIGVGLGPGRFGPLRRMGFRCRARGSNRSAGDSPLPNQIPPIRATTPSSTAASTNGQRRGPRGKGPRDDG